MGRPDSLAATSLALAVGVATCALLLGLRLWWERRTRGRLSDVDRRHFLIQDLRRGLGILLLGYLAFSVYAGSRLPIFVAEPSRPGEDGVDRFAAGALIAPAPTLHPNRQFLAIWLAAFASIVLLLGLALIDWISTRRYALRHRREMDQERLEILQETVRHASATEDGQAEAGSVGRLD